MISGCGQVSYWCVPCPVWYRLSMVHTPSLVVPSQHRPSYCPALPAAVSLWVSCKPVEGQYWSTGTSCSCTWPFQGALKVVIARVLITHFLALGWSFFEPMWTHVSTVTITNGYARLRTATLHDPHSSSKSPHTHSQPHPCLSKLCSVFPLCLIVSNRGREGGK